MACEIPKNGMLGASVPVRDASLKVTGQIRYGRYEASVHALCKNAFFFTSSCKEAALKTASRTYTRRLKCLRQIIAQ